MMTMTMIILKMPITNPDGKSELSEPGHAGGEADQVESTLFSHRDLAVLKRVLCEIVEITKRDNNKLNPGWPNHCILWNAGVKLLPSSLLSLSLNFSQIINSHIFYCNHNNYLFWDLVILQSEDEAMSIFRLRPQCQTSPCLAGCQNIVILLMTVKSSQVLENIWTIVTIFCDPFCLKWEASCLK